MNSGSKATTAVEVVNIYITGQRVEAQGLEFLMPSNVVDECAIRSHVALLHELARPVGEGKLVAIGFHEPPEGSHRAKRVGQFPVGEVESMVEWIVHLAGQPGWNVYASTAVYRADLPAKYKGCEADVLAVPCIVMDFDDAAAADYDGRLPRSPDMVVRTSEGRFQCFHLFPRPLSVADAKKIACAVAEEAGADPCSKDMAHIWRVPGTLNWPTRRKLERGRKPEPQMVKLVVEPDGNRTDPASLPHEAQVFATSLLAGTTGVAVMELPTTDVQELVEKLRSDRATRFIVEKLEHSPPEGTRSDHIYNVVGLLKGTGLNLGEVVALLRAMPAGGKYVGRAPEDLVKEVERCWCRTSESSQPFKAGALAGLIPAGADEIAESKCYRILPRSALAHLAHVEYLVQGLVPARGLMAIAGQPGTFKSFLMLDLASCIATGREFHGLPVRQGHVVCVAAEGTAGIHKRACAWELHHGVGVPDERFAVVPEAVLLDEPLSLSKLASTFEARVAQFGPIDLVVLDTLSRTFSGDENSPELTGYIRAIDLLRRKFGTAVCVVHHTPKDAVDKSGPAFFRGHSSLFGALDVGLGMRRKGSSVVELCASEKAPKDDEAQPNMLFRVETIDLTGFVPPNQDGSPPTSLVLVPCETAPSSTIAGRSKSRKTEQAKEYILATLKRGGKTQADLWAEFDPDKQDCTRKLIGRALIRLFEDGRIARSADETIRLNGYVGEEVADTCPDMSGQMSTGTP